MPPWKKTEKNAIQLSDHFSYAKLLRFTFPSIAMMIFTSIYGVIDGFFVSNYVSEAAFTAVNFIMPFLMLLGAVGFMFGTGGSALIAKTMGQGEKENAEKIFSLIVCTALVIGCMLTVLGLVFLRPFASLLGAEGRLLEDCVIYGRMIIIAVPAFVLQQAFQSFFIAAEKSNLGFLVTVAAGITNMILDALLVAVLNLGLQGAAAATAISAVIGGFVPLLYFSRPNQSRLRLRKTKFDSFVLLRTCANGSSELMSSVSTSIVSMLYNTQLMKYAGENGVSAYGVLMYVNLIFLAVFIGYSIGAAPVISYHYGAENHSELKGLLKKSAVIMIGFSVCMFLASQFLSVPLTGIFVKPESDSYELTIRAFSIFSYSFLFAGISIFSSAFFTALNDGLTSALVSFLRTLVFQTASVLLLPLLLKTEGIWAAMIVAELVAGMLSICFIFGKRKKYHYL
ncbi:MAG: MATE family efflux transporter [Oscillospiraceae bacterium]|nr:MATE family efflux transporter [Oscillospiraceae bacterium]